MLFLINMLSIHTSFANNSAVLRVNHFFGIALGIDSSWKKLTFAVKIADSVSADHIDDFLVRCMVMSEIRSKHSILFVYMVFSSLFYVDLCRCYH